MELRTYITGQLEPFTKDVKDKFDDAENYLLKMNLVPINPLKINAYQLAPWSVRFEMLSTCDAIYLLCDFIHNQESVMEKYYCEMTGKKIIFQSQVNEDSSRECFERPLIARVTGAIESVTGKKFSDYREENRKPEVSYPRMIFSYECLKRELPIDRIAYYLNRDITTIKHQLKKYEDNHGFVRDFRAMAEKVDKILEPEKD